MTPCVKALLQLALLRRYWAKVRPGDADLGEVTATVERVWRQPEFARLMAAEPSYARQHQLMYGALAPPGMTSMGRGGPHTTALARLAADGYLAPGRKSPYLRLEIRHYADLAGVEHRIESYAELHEASLLAHAETLPVADLDVCVITHTIFISATSASGILS